MDTNLIKNFSKITCEGLDIIIGFAIEPLTNGLIEPDSVKKLESFIHEMEITKARIELECDVLTEFLSGVVNNVQ